jgi:hypothetical protein
MYCLLVYPYMNMLETRRGRVAVTGPIGGGFQNSVALSKSLNREREVSYVGTGTCHVRRVALVL